jgi:peptidoglycan hydrolase-like protein with peptidoglycan-binding domain
VFGSITEDALRKFQSENNLLDDGIAGPDTLQALGLQP